MVVALPMAPIVELKLTPVPFATATPKASVMLADTVTGVLPQVAIAGLTARLTRAGAPPMKGPLHGLAYVA
jgi:hypothetical protein